MGTLEAEEQFRTVIGYTDLLPLAIAIARQARHHQPNPVMTQEAAIELTL